jgi:hypothetical protein
LVDDAYGFDAVTPVLAKEVPGLLDSVEGQREALARAGLEAGLLDRTREAFPEG